VLDEIGRVVTLAVGGALLTGKAGLQLEQALDKLRHETSLLWVI
jgi:hypothetical protein